MKSIYLTKTRKKRYMDDFVNKVLPFNALKFWALDEGLPEILSNINSNNNIQTLYSKRPSFDKTGRQNLSYLEFCYRKEIELSLFRDIIPSLFLDIDLNPEDRLYYLYHFPGTHSYCSSETSIGLGCIDDKKYFFINSIKINLESEIQSAHNHFWLNLEKKLSRIGI